MVVGPVERRGRNSKFKKFCPRTYRIYMPSFINVGPAVLERKCFENVDTAWIDEWTNICLVLQVILAEMTNEICTLKKSSSMPRFF